MTMINWQETPNFRELPDALHSDSSLVKLWSYVDNDKRERNSQNALREFSSKFREFPTRFPEFPVAPQCNEMYGIHVRTTVRYNIKSECRGLWPSIAVSSRLSDKCITTICCTGKVPVAIVL